MSIGVLHGQTGGIKLPFRVIGGTTQPSNPKDGTIWVKTSVPIMRTEFANGTWASGGVGLVFLAGTLGGSNPTGANSTVWAINKITGASKYVLKITLTGCKQVQGSKGNWVDLDAYRYYGGTWVQFSSVNVIPKFTYTGDYEIVNDADYYRQSGQLENPISDIRYTELSGTEWRREWNRCVLGWRRRWWPWR